MSKSSVSDTGRSANDESFKLAELSNEDEVRVGRRLAALDRGDRVEIVRPTARPAISVLWVRRP